MNIISQVSQAGEQSPVTTSWLVRDLVLGSEREPPSCGVKRLMAVSHISVIGQFFSFPLHSQDEVNVQTVQCPVNKTTDPHF